MRGRFSASFVGALLTIFGANPAVAQSIDDQRRALAVAQAQAARAARTANLLEIRAKAEADAAKAADAKAAALAARIQQIEADLGAGEARLLLIEKLRERVRARLAERQRPAIRLIAAVQSYARRPAALALLQPGSLWDLVHIQLILAHVGPELRNRTRQLQAELAQKRALEGAARKTLADLAQSKRHLTTAQMALAKMEAAHRAASLHFSQQAMTAQDKALSMGEQARDIIELIDQLGEESVRISQLAALPGPLLRPMNATSSATPPIMTEVKSPHRLSYRLPVTGKLVAGLGEAGSSGARAKGLVFATRAEAQIIAPRRGQIVFAGPFRGYGQIVIIDHGSGWTSLVTNMSRLTVRVGQSVGDGAPIGRAGPGSPRVIVELRRAGQPVDITRLVS